MQRLLLSFFFVVIIGWATILQASLVPAVRNAWDGSPIAWKFDESHRRISAVGVDDCAILESERSSKIVFVANVTPTACRSRDWATFGIGITDDENNYWRLSFVQAPPKKDKIQVGERGFVLKARHRI